MSFRFSLAALLRLREIAEEREERLLTGILLQIAQTRQAIDEADLALEQLAAGREAALRTTTAAAELHLFYERRSSIGASRRLYAEQLSKLEELRLQQLGRYQRAHRGRRMLTDMEADQRKAWEAARGRQEQKAADDLFLARRRQATEQK